MEMGWMCGDGGWEGEGFLSEERGDGRRTRSRDSDVGSAPAVLFPVLAALALRAWNGMAVLPFAGWLGKTYDAGGRAYSAGKERGSV
jgi:hypothetical protein